MKKKIMASVIAVVMLIVSLTSCDLIFGSVAQEGCFTVVVENTDGSYEVFETGLDAVENKDEGAKGVLEHLSTGSDRLYLEMTDSSYGAYVSAIGSIRESTEDKMYVIVYTSVATDSYEGATTIDYNGVTLYQAGVGLSGMTVAENGIILFRLERSPY